MSASDISNKVWIMLIDSELQESERYRNGVLQSAFGGCL